MTPLPIAFPADRSAATAAGLRDSPLDHQWMVGNSILAAPLAHADYRDSDTRDVYLPPGVWIDLATGQRHEGPALLDDHPAPMSAVPAFAGGPGVILLRDKRGRLVCHAFPTPAETVTEHFTLDGGPTIAVTNSPGWTEPTVVDHARKTVQTTTPAFTGAVAFEVVAGGRYTVTDRSSADDD